MKERVKSKRVILNRLKMLGNLVDGLLKKNGRKCKLYAGSKTG
jgi:hypothetical protein